VRLPERPPLSSNHSRPARGAKLSLRERSQQAHALASDPDRPVAFSAFREHDGVRGPALAGGQRSASALCWSLADPEQLFERLDQADERL
jgi:hypothetical protein